jgi:hypothetical protein
MNRKSNTLAKSVTMDNYPHNHVGDLVPRRTYVTNAVRDYERLHGATMGLMREGITRAVIGRYDELLEYQNPLMRRRLNAPYVDLQQYWTYEEQDYLGHGRPTDTIVGPSVAWVVAAKEKLKNNEVPFFVLCRPQHPKKTVCVVRDYGIVVIDNVPGTLQVTCLTSQRSFPVEFRHIWEIILDAPVLLFELRSNVPMPYARSAELRSSDAHARTIGIEVTTANAHPAQRPSQRASPDAPQTDDYIAERRIQ